MVKREEALFLSIEVGCDSEISRPCDWLLLPASTLRAQGANNDTTFRLTEDQVRKIVDFWAIQGQCEKGET